MLTRRTNVLLEEADYMTLSAISHQTGDTIGELIRKAIRKNYRTSDIVRSRKQIFASIKKLARQVNTKGINYRALIKDGRKY